MQTNPIDYEAEVQKLLQRLQGQPSLLEAIEVLEDLHRLGVWSRGSLRARGTLAVPASPRLPARDLQLVRTFVHKGFGESCRKALLAVAQWGGGESVFEPIALLNEKGLDKEVDGDTPSYCVSSLRYIGGPLAVRAIIDVLEDENREVSSREMAVEAVEELATGGLVPHIDRTSDAGTVAAAAKGLGLDPALAGRLHFALNQICESRSVPFRLQFRAAEVLEILEAGGITKDPSQQLLTHLQPVVPDDPQRAIMGYPVSEGRPGARNVTAQLVRGSGGAAAEVMLELLPRLSDVPGTFEEIRPCVYLSTRQTAVVILRIVEVHVPDGVAAVHVRARVADQDSVRPEVDTELMVGGAAVMFEFRIPEPYAWAEKPQFILTLEK